jgi:hypothetical protein
MKSDWNTDEIWRAFDAEEGVSYHWTLNGAEAFLRREGALWETAFMTQSMEDATEKAGFYKSAEKFDGASFININFSFISVGTGSKVSLHPYVPEKPFILNLVDKLRILPGREIRLKAALPPVLQFELDGECMERCMPLTLNETWEGVDTVNGTLAYALGDVASPFMVGEIDSLPEMGGSLKDCHGASALIHTEIIVRNRSKMPFDLDHVVIWTQTLDIFENKGCLVGDLVIIEMLVNGDLRLTSPPAVPDGFKKISSGVKDGMGDRLIRQGASFLLYITSMNVRKPVGWR